MKKCSCDSGGCDGLCAEGCACNDCSCGTYAALFETLGNQKRMRVLTSLRKGPRNVSQIIRETGLEQTYVSHCLRALEGSGFVTVEKSGKYRIYTLNKKTIEPLLALIDRHARTLAREVS